MPSRTRLGVYGPTRELTSPFDGRCTPENARLAKAVGAMGPLWFGDMKIRTEILHLTCPPPKSAARYHLHPFMEVTYVRAGGMEYCLEDRSIPVRQGEIFLMPPETVHGWRSRWRPATLFGFLLSISPATNRTDSLAFRLGEAAAGLLYRFRPDPDLRAAFEALCSEVRRERSFQQEVAAADVRLVLMLVFRHLSDFLGLKPPAGAQEEPDSRGHRLFLQAKVFLEANLAFGASVADAARHLGISARHVNRLFKARQGVPAGRFVAAARLELAKTLLRERRDLAVKGVASRCGFSDVSYFCRFFREHTGKSPAGYGGEKVRRKGV